MPNEPGFLDATSPEGLPLPADHRADKLGTLGHEGLAALLDEINAQPPQAFVTLNSEEVVLLKKILEREITSRPTYDGLQQLLSLSSSDAEALLALLRRL